MLDLDKDNESHRNSMDESFCGYSDTMLYCMIIQRPTPNPDTSRNGPHRECVPLPRAVHILKKRRWLVAAITPCFPNESLGYLDES